jgi:excisionase family DNA binding protein
MDSSTDCFMPLRRLAKYAGLSVRTLRGHLSRPVNSLPHYKVGGKILVRRSEFDQWLGQFKIDHDNADIDALFNDVLTAT